jgi:hypothetical protein
MNQDNGGIIGKLNTPTTTVASGVWTLQDQFEAQTSSIWPLAFPQTTFTNSCIWNSADDAHMHITYGSAGNQKTWTWSGWVKRAKTGVQNDLWSMGSANNTFGIVYISSNDDFTFYEADSGGTTAFLGTNQLFRDPGAWYHILFVLDTTQSTADNRQRLYVNGTEVTSFANRTNPSLNADLKINSAAKHYLGGTSTGLSDLEWDGCMSQVIFVDGQALTPTSFGATNPVTNIWEPIAYTGTYGSNGYILNFSDSSALGDDTSGNTNDLTVSNIASTDQSTDTPSNNFATMNPLDNYFYGATFSEGNLKLVQPGSTECYTTSTIAVSSGKWYWEVKITASGSGKDFVGVADTTSKASDFTPYSGNSQVLSYYGFTGTSQAGSTGTSYGDTFTTGDIIGVALDLDNNKLYFSKNGTFQNSGDPTSGSTGTGALAVPASPADGHWYAQFSNIHNTSSTFEINFGNPSFSISSGNADANGFGNFEYAVPSGYFSLCTKNLAEFG